MSHRSLTASTLAYASSIRRWATRPPGIAAAASAVLVLALWLSIGPFGRTPPFAATATVSRITPGPDGLRQATFRLANDGRYPILIFGLYSLQARLGHWRTKDLPAGAKIVQETNLFDLLPFHPNAKRLGPGESYEVKLRLPFDGEEWRASFHVVQPDPPLRAMINSWLRRAGFAPAEPRQSYLPTEWMER